MCFSKKIENGIIFGNPKNRFTSIRIRETAMAVPLLRCSSFDDDPKMEGFDKLPNWDQTLTEQQWLKAAAAAIRDLHQKCVFNSRSLSLFRNKHIWWKTSFRCICRNRTTDRANNWTTISRCFGFLFPRFLSFFRSQLSNERTNETVDFREQTFREPKQIFRELIVLFF